MRSTAARAAVSATGLVVPMVSYSSAMLEHVGEAGSAFGVVNGAGVDVGVEGDDGGFMAFEDDEVESVGEGELGDLFFESFEVLGVERGGGEARDEGEGDDEVEGFH